MQNAQVGGPIGNQKSPKYQGDVLHKIFENVTINQPKMFLETSELLQITPFFYFPPSIQENYNTPIDHTPGNPPLRMESLIY